MWLLYSPQIILCGHASLQWEANPDQPGHTPIPQLTADAGGTQLNQKEDPPEPTRDCQPIQEYSK